MGRAGLSPGLLTLVGSTTPQPSPDSNGPCWAQPAPGAQLEAESSLSGAVQYPGNHGRVPNNEPEGSSRVDAVRASLYTAVWLEKGKPMMPPHCRRLMSPFKVTSAPHNPTRRG